MANIQQASAQDKVEKIAKITLWTLIGLTILVVALFVGIGYDTPYEEKPTIVNPQLTDLLICWTYFLIAAAALATIGAILYGFVSGGNKSRNEDKGFLKHTGIVAWGTFIVSIVVGIALGAANSSEVLLINGKDWNEPSAIIITDASMVSIIVLTIVTVIATAYSMITSKK